MKNLFIILISFCFVANSYAQVGINATNTPPDPSAMLDINSTNKGLLIPRMNTAQKNAIPNKVEGLTVYDTDLKQFSYWKTFTGGTALGYWQDFGNPPATSTNVWNTNGNNIENTNSGSVVINPMGFIPTSKLDIHSNATTALRVIQVGPYKGVEIQSGTTNNMNPVLEISNSTSGYGGYFRAYNSVARGLYSLLEDSGNNHDAIEGLTFGTGRGGYFSSSLGAALVTGTGNVGIGVDNPTKAKLEVTAPYTTTALFGSTSTGISLQQNWPTVGFNQYRDNANVQRYIGNGYAMGNFIDPTTGTMAWNSITSGTAGNATPSEQTIMLLTNGGNLGVGTAPATKFHIKYLQPGYGSGSGITPYGIAGFESNIDAFINLMSPSAYQSGVLFGSPLSSTRGGIIYTNNNGGSGESLALRTGGNINRLVIDKNGNVAIGDFMPTNKLDVNGTMRAKEVIIETGWADYVFEKNYHLKSIDELEVFVKENKHLPNIPAASEIEKYGLKVGETNKAMMEKIEELALYIIQLKKEIDLLKAKN